MKINFKKIKKLKRKKPKFRRYNWFKKNLSENWRKPRGLHSKVRIKEKSKPLGPNIGYRAAKEIRGLHPSGYFEVLVRKIDDLKLINPETQAARLSSNIGKRKRQILIEKAKELKIKVLNP